MAITPSSCGAGRILLSASKFSFVLGNATNCESTTSTSITNMNKWVHIVGTYNSSTAVIYINGFSEGSSLITLTTPPLNSTGINLGSLINANYCFNGSIDDVMIFNRSLSAAEVQALYNNQK
jgi:hypothetical protein